MSGQIYTDAILEDINAKFDFLLELVQPLVGLPQLIDDIEQRLARMAQDQEVSSAALRSVSRELINH